MSEDYFDDGSDADFLALAQQLEGKNNNSGGNATLRATSSAISGRSSGPSRGEASSAANIPSSSAATSRIDPSKTNQTAPRVQRPGFNAVIVNTRQVHSEKLIPTNIV